jgi:glutathione S-transferase
MTLRLHYAPDNASLCIRLALEVRGLGYETALVDRRARAHKAAPYLSLNPNGLIPVLETPEGPMFETGAILLWLADTHGGLGPGPGDPGRARFLTWLFWLSNTLHAAERMLFYPGEYHPGQEAALTAQTCARVTAALDVLEAASPALTGCLGGAEPTILDCYLAPLMRWPAIYAPGSPPGWYDIGRWPRLRAVVVGFEARPAVQAAARAEGLGPAPFTAPRPPHPPEGSAT